MTGNFQPYAEYLDSGVVWVGKVPAHWELVKFKRVLNEKKKTDNQGLPAGSISFGSVVYKSTETLAEATKASYQEVLPGEFLVNPLNLNFDLKSLRTALSDIAVVVSTGYIVVRSSKNLDKRFTRWLLQEFDVAHMKTLGAGVRQTISFTDIGNSLFFEPPMEEQTQIAKFLDYETAKIDALVEKQQQLIALLKEKRQAVISHAVTKGLNPDAPMRDSGVEWLGEVPENWKVSALKHVASTTNGYGFSSIDFLDEGVPFIRAGNIKAYSITSPKIFLTEKVVSRFGRLRLKPGEVLISMVGSDPSVKESAVGQIGVVPTALAGGVPNQNVVIMRETAGQMTKRFLFHSLCSSAYRNHLDVFSHKLANQSIISSGLIVAAKLCVPPISEQDNIAQYLDARLPTFDAMSERADATISLLQERRTALISAAVTGKIDVRGWKAPETETQSEVA